MIDLFLIYILVSNFILANIIWHFKFKLLKIIKPKETKDFKYSIFFYFYYSDIFTKFVDKDTKFWALIPFYYEHIKIDKNNVKAYYYHNKIKKVNLFLIVNIFLTIILPLYIIIGIIFFTFISEIF